MSTTVAGTMTGTSLFNDERQIAGLIDLSILPGGGRRRIKKRLAKKVMRCWGRYPKHLRDAAYKTLQRPKNLQRWTEWKTLTDEEKQARKWTWLMSHATIGLAPLLAYSIVRNHGRYLADPCSRRRKGRRR